MNLGPPLRKSGSGFTAERDEFGSAFSSEETKGLDKLFFRSAFSYALRKAFSLGLLQKRRYRTCLVLSKKQKANKVSLSTLLRGSSGLTISARRLVSVWFCLSEEIVGRRRETEWGTDGVE